MKMKIMKKAFTIFAAAAMLLSLIGLASQFATMEVYAEDSRPALVVAIPQAIKPVYDGTEQVLVLPGKAYGGTMMYALGASNKTAPEDGWSTELPTAKDAKTYYVWFYAKGNGAYEDSEKDYVDASIETRGINVHIHSAWKLVGAPDPEFTYSVTGFLEGDEPGEITILRAPGETAGEYSWDYKHPDLPNYVWSATSDRSFRIYESAPTPPTKMNLIGRVVWVDANNANGERRELCGVALINND